MHPGVAHLEALFAAFRFRLDALDLIEMGASIGHASLQTDGLRRPSLQHQKANHIAARIGMRTWKRVSPGTDLTVIRPRAFLTMRLTMSSPKPVPSPTPFVVKKGSKMRDWTSAGMPGPLSAISTRTKSFSRAVRMVSLPVPFMASAALSMRLVHT